MRLTDGGAEGALWRVPRLLGLPHLQSRQADELGGRLPDRGQLVQRRTKRGRLFYGCNRYPDCQYTLWSKPVPMPCPECQAPFLVEQGGARKGKVLRCVREGCGYESPVEGAVAQPGDSA
jgi:DNA topoisomerase-1